MIFLCPTCKKEFPLYYLNKREASGGYSYYGNGQKYNFRGARGNFLKHIRACAKKRTLKMVDSTERELGQARKDVCFISEIINDLNKSKYTEVTHGSKAGTMLLDWQDELIGKSGFDDIEEVRAYHAEHVGAENW